jgi:microcystin-dependent protein
MPAHNHQVLSNPDVINTLAVVASATLQCSNQNGNSLDPSNGFPAKIGSLGNSAYTSDAQKATSQMNNGAIEINAALEGNVEVTIQNNCSNTGEGVPFDNMPPWLCLNYIICYNGKYPQEG